MGPYRPFDLRVLRTVPLGPSFVRVTLGGPDLAGFSAHGYDQRMNLAFGPAAATLLTAPDWTPAWRGNGISLRTYTIRAFRPAALEVDVDFVRHGSGGPAGRWASSCRAGDRLVMIAATHGHPASDVAWAPPPAAERVLIAADETGVPAAAGILVSLPSSAAPTVVLEVPTPGDILDIPGPAASRVLWLARSRGERLEPVVRDLLDASAPIAAGVPVRATAGAGASALAPDLGGASALALDLGAASALAADLAGASALDLASADIADEDPDEEIWDVPVSAAGGFYAWLAGESGTVTALRRHLVTHQGIDRKAVAFMGYWNRRRPPK